LDNQSCKSRLHATLKVTALEEVTLLCTALFLMFTALLFALQPPTSPETPSTSIAPPSSTPSYVPQAVSSTSQAPPSDALSESTINLKRELEVRNLFIPFLINTRNT